MGLAQPQTPLLRRENGRHPVSDGSDQHVRLGCDHDKRLDQHTVAVRDRIPDDRDAERLGVAWGQDVLDNLLADFLADIERPDRQDAATHREAILEDPERINRRALGGAATEDYNKVHNAEVETRQVKYLNNIVEQDHRAIKRQVRPMMGFKSFWSAAATLAGIELMHMIRKGQMKPTDRLRPAQQFYALAN
jgi:putative transposase